ncbi:hypothetical protein EC973_009326 [Apophysomyces ossiformis]|uniref:Bacterial surface antigen (D15) domain-containing protein n=1 Tax=Apophysomyces ossiformis TaxID=679940 RepID=A0A8H7EU77_9FUNG|nr:hypothetical protein EC973_009326 [Apophysomyces ossiformis]
MTDTAQTPIIADAPLHVNALRILGVTATRSSFLNSATAHVFEAKTTADVLRNVQEVAVKLQKHDIFDEIKVYLDSNHGVTDTVDMTIHLKEKPKTLLKTAFGVSENEATLNGGIYVRNLFGGAETFSTSYTFGNRTKAAWEAFLGMPINGSPYAKIEAFVNSSVKDHSIINYYKEQASSVGARFKGESSYGQHQITYALINRDLTALSESSATVRAHSGPNVKSSVFHSFVRDERDNATMPTSGHYVGFFQEFAGVGNRGDSQFLKSELAAQYHRTLATNSNGWRLVLSAGIKSGFNASLDNKELNVSDRLYLGGPLSVRGFKMGGIGPRNGNDALGGEAYWAAGASLVSTIPGAAHLPVKAHAFFNAGNIIPWDKATPLNTTITTLSEDPRTSAGFGLIFHHDVARVEANFCIPLRFKTGDVPKPGFQIGLGINFL